MILANRRALSVLAAATVEENLDNLVNLGISYTTRRGVVEYIEKGDWKSALNLITQSMESFPYFERLVLHDSQGVIKADMPVATPSVVGQSRADRDWYIGVKRSWKPYISRVYIRGAEPKIPVVTVAVPIKTMPTKTKTDSLAAGKGQKVVGVLQFQITLDLFHRWIDKINYGPGSIIYIVDQYGGLVYHPKYIKERTVTDFSSVGIVTKVLKGIRGCEVNYNPIEKEERVASYEPVSSYGWGVVVTQPTVFAFIEKNKELKMAIIIYAVIFSFAGSMALIILNSIVIIKRGEKTLKESEERYRAINGTGCRYDLSAR
ncbi:MAG: cache domain-containing protein [Proteobacteria bacterium]|nr:cache domain-containing protein [Pseudomonadota bacterium]